VSPEHLFTGQQNQNPKDHLLFKVEIDGLQRSERFESLNKVFQTLICEFFAAVCSQQNHNSKGHYLLKSRLMDCKKVSA